MAKEGLRRGVFITFEGAEGCRKSTHSKLLYRYLKKKGYSCVRTKEPGGTKTADGIRRVLLDPKNKNINEIAELFLFEASRSLLARRVIKPALEKKKIVICDRFYDATVAYQGYGSRLDIGLIKKMNTLAADNIRPDLTIVLDIRIKEGLRRAALCKQSRDRMERKGASYYDRVRKGYAEIAKKEPRRVKVIATKKDRNETQKLIRQEALNVVQRYKTAG